MLDDNKITKQPGSAQWFATLDKTGFIYRCGMKNQDIPGHHFQGKQIIGIFNNWSKVIPRNSHFRKRQGIPTSVNQQPSGQYLMGAFYYAGLPALPGLGSEANLLPIKTVTAKGKSLWDNNTNRVRIFDMGGRGAELPGYSIR